MKSPTVPIVLVILAVLVGGGLWIDHQREAQRATLTGYFEYRPTDISSRVTGRVVKLNVDDGDSAQTGDILIQLDSASQTQDYEAREAQAQSAYDQLQEAQAGPRIYDIERQQAVVAAAQANLNKLLNGALPDEKRQAVAQVAAAQAAYSAELPFAGVRPGIVQALKEQADQAKAAQQVLLNGPRHEDIDIARANLTQAEDALRELEAGTRPEETKAAQAQYLAASAAAKSAKSLASEEVVKAPFNCEIEHVLVTNGDLVPAGTPLLRISNPSNIWLTVYAPEDKLASISVGESAVLKVDGIDRDIDAKVKSIATSGEFTPANLQSPEERGQQVYAVRLRLAKPDLRIKAGMAATVKSIGDWQP